MLVDLTSRSTMSQLTAGRMGALNGRRHSVVTLVSTCLPWSPTQAMISGHRAKHDDAALGDAVFTESSVYSRMPSDIKTRARPSDAHAALVAEAVCRARAPIPTCL